MCSSDLAQYVFNPAGTEDTTFLIVAHRRVIVVTPHRVRSYPREAVRAGFGADLRGGVRFRLVLGVPPAGRDTVFRSLSFRDLYALVPRVEKLLNEDSATAATPLRRP